MKARAENGWAMHVFKAEHLFLENIYSEKDMQKMGIDNFKIYSNKLETILDQFEEFCESLENPNDDEREEVEAIISDIKKIKISAKQDEKISREKAIIFLYQYSIHFLKNEKINVDIPISNKFLSNVIAFYENKKTIHHSHVAGKIIGYAHDFCNQKVKENYYTIPVFTHNQFRFDFFLILKGFRPTVGRTQDISIGGRNPSNVNFAIIRNQVKFIDTVKYFQQSLGNLANSMTDEERQNVRRTCRNFISNRLMFLTEENEKWVLDYLCLGKGMIPYQMFKKIDLLDIKPEYGDFFDHESFYSTLKEKDISKEEYENVKKFFKLLRLKTLGDLNKIYNFQDTSILCEIFEKRYLQLQKLFKYNPRKCNSASAFSGCVQRLKSKSFIALPVNAEITRVFEQTLFGGYSCVNTRMTFDTEVFLKDFENEKNLFKTKDNQLKRFSSKIIKMDENNQYGMAMTRPLPYGSIKRKKSFEY